MWLSEFSENSFLLLQRNISTSILWANLFNAHLLLTWLYLALLCLCEELVSYIFLPNCAFVIIQVKCTYKSSQTWKRGFKLKKKQPFAPKGSTPGNGGTQPFAFLNPKSRGSSIDWVRFRFRHVSSWSHPLFSPTNSQNRAKSNSIFPEKLRADRAIFGSPMAKFYP